VGVSIVTFTISDAAGNTSSCSLSVVVTDAQLPTIVCPTAAPIQSDCPVSVLVSNQNPSNCMFIAWSTPPAPLPATANIGATQYLLLSGTGTVGDPALYRRNGFNGACGNSANLPFTGTLTIGGESCDFENGVTPPNYVFERENTDGICGYIAEGGEFNATGADNCGVASVSHNYGGWAIANNLDGATFPVGTTSVTWTVVDLSGNSTQCTITIVVEDTENPVFVNCPNTTFTIGVDADCESGIIWSIPIAEDNCDIASVIETTPTPGPYYGQPLAPGTYDIQYTATDIYDNTAICNFTIIVEDDSDPLLVCPPNFTVGTDTGVCTWASTASTNPLLTVDNCPDYVLTYTLSGATVDSGTGVVPANTIFNEGVTTVTYELEDGAGNTSVCSFTVTVSDDEAPAIAAALCNETYNFDTDLGECTSDQSMDIADFVSDNCSDDTDLTYLTVITNPDGSLQTLNGSDIDYTLELGVSYALFTITDEAGNSSTCLVSVIVSDNELPVIECPVTDNPYDNTPGVCGLVAGTQFDPTNVDDNCTFTYSHNYGGWAVPTSLAGATFPIGTTNVTWTVIDGSGNSTFCVITITVEDTEDPVAGCIPSLDAVLDADGQFQVTIPMIELGSTDNCGGTLSYAISRDGMTFGDDFYVNCADALNTPVIATLRVTDGNGNIDECTTTVNVFDLDPPTAVCQDIVVDLNANGEVTIIPSQVDGGSSDNCEVEDVSVL
jgi:hypothetical protein